MKITKLQVRNMYGLKAFDWDGKSIEVNGVKGSGKTSLIHAIKYALTNKADREYIISDGATEAEVLIETDTGLRVNRKVRSTKADYKSIKQGNEKDEKNESFLREIFTELQLNPVEFTDMDEKEQNRIILDLIDFKWDMKWIAEQFGEIPPEVDYEQNILRVLHDIQAEDGHYFMKRQDINREIRNKQAFIAEIGQVLPVDYNVHQWKDASLSEIYKRIETIRNQNEWIEKAKRAVSGRDGKARSFEAEYEIEKSTIDRETVSTRNSLEKQIVEMENRIKAMRKDLDVLEDKRKDKLSIAKKTFEAKIAALDGEVKQYAEMAGKEPTSFDALQKEAENIEKMKSFINEYDRMVSLQDDVVDLTKKTEELTGKIEKARSLPGEILQNAKIPVTGLEIKDGIPLINGRPLSNLSDGEKLLLCVEISVQKEGALKLILIDGVERLDTKARTALYKMLKARGVQFISSRVTDSDLLTVVEL